jgi:hypothetical protein
LAVSGLSHPFAWRLRLGGLAVNAIACDMQRGKSGVQTDATSRPLRSLSNATNLTKTRAGQHQALMQENSSKEDRKTARAEANPKARWVWVRPQGWGAGDLASRLRLF